MRLLICCAASRCPTFRTSTFYISFYFAVSSTYSEALPAISTFQLDLAIRAPIGIGFPIKPHWLPIPPAEHLAPPIKSHLARPECHISLYYYSGQTKFIAIHPVPIKIPGLWLVYQITLTLVYTHGKYAQLLQ